MKKVKIVCDVDGVILDFSKSFARFWNSKYPDHLISERPKSWRFGLPKEMHTRLHDEVNNFGRTEESGKLEYLFTDIDPYFNYLSEIHDIHIVTACPEEFKENRILNLNYLKYSSLAFKSKNKAKYIIEEVKPFIAIEDYPENVVKLSVAGIKVYYPDLPYTAGYEAYGTPFNSWKELHDKWSVGVYL
jgi:hypothetical protein